MSRVLSGIQPSGVLHLGNYLGALRRWVQRQDVDDAYFCIVDLHALTLDIEPEALRSQTLDAAASYLAAGLDPDRAVLFVQSHVPEHTSLSWLLECTASYGELLRMTQFKDKGKGQASVRAGLLTYPVLMAADILVYDAQRVPVGDDQRQHIELARNLAIRFNGRYGETFVVPAADIPDVGARIMDLQQPTKKMSKSTSTPQGLINLTDSPDEIARKVRRAVTDTDNEVRYDTEAKPGISNLLEILASATGAGPDELADRFSDYGSLKGAVAEAVIELLRPVRESYEELSSDPGTVRAALAKGAEKAQSVAGPVLARAQDAVGLLK
ncbi:MAG: tryptophanyl-tRNA synthetase [Acidimicrobiaceae bacterium]|nr:tryptophanyl-tRNA synthetase [Acidimicrobiaceae bacterium]